MKKFAVFCLFIFFSVTGYSSQLDINIIYEASVMKVKETLCGTEPDFDGGYILTENDCYQTMYELDEPMYGFSFEPKTVPDENYKLAYYISFFDSAFPPEDLVKTEIIKEGEVLREVDNLVHERTFQGLLVLENGQTVRLSSAEEPSYMIIYVLAFIVVAGGAFFILRRKK